MSNNSLQYASSELPETDRFDIWRELFGKKMVGFEMSHVDQRPFFTEAQFRALGAVRMSRNASTSMRFIRNRTMISAEGGGDCLGLPICVDGTWEVIQKKQRLAMNRHTVALVDLGIPIEGALHCTSNSSHHALLSLCLPKQELLRRVPQLERRIMEPFCNLQGLDLLVNYLSMIKLQDYQQDASLEQLMGEQILDIIAFICQPTDQDSGGIRAARKAELIRYLEKHYWEPGLTGSSIASALKISRRYLYRLLDESEETLSQTLNRIRLERASRLLAKPNYRHLSIVEIAFQSGFNDLSNFYRLFRSRFGESPGAFRSRHAVSKT